MIDPFITTLVVSTLVIVVTFWAFAGFINNVLGTLSMLLYIVIINGGGKWLFGIAATIFMLIVGAGLYFWL